MAGQRAADTRQCMGPAPARVAPAPPLRDARGSQHPVCGAVTEALSWLFCCALAVGAGLLLAGHGLRGPLDASRAVQARVMDLAERNGAAQHVLDNIEVTVVYPQ